MLKTVKVKKIWRYKTTGTRAIFYDDYIDGKEHVAACVEGLYPEVGDTVEVYADKDVDYRGCGAIAFRMVDTERKIRKRPQLKAVRIKKIKRQQMTGVITIFYNDPDADNAEKVAAGVEYLHPKEGDIIEVYADEYINYHGLGAMALKVVV